MNRLPWLLRALLAPFFMHIDGADGGGGDTASDDSGVDWGELNEGVDPGADDDSDDDGVAAAPAPSPAPAKPASQPAKPAAKAPVPTDPATGDDQVDPEPELDANGNPIVPPEVPDQPQTLTPEQQAAQEKELRENFTKWEQAQIESLTKAYAFDEDTAARLQTEPEIVLPQIAAKLHMDVMKSVVETVTRMLPNVVQPVLSQQDNEKKAIDFFYGKNPDLKNHHKQVMIAGKMYRQMNPKASPEEAATAIGNIVRQSMGLAPVETKAPTGTPAGRAKPHRPAQPGSGSGTRPAPAAKKGGGEGEVAWSDLLDD